MRILSGLLLMMAAFVPGTAIAQPGPGPLASAGGSPSMDALHTPPKGSAERKAIMDAIRANFKEGSGQTAVFLVNYLKVHNGWAWADVTPLDAKGKPIAEGGTLLLRYENDTWSVADISKVPDDPDDPMGSQDASPGFIKGLRKIYPAVPLDIFPKGRH
ncbi:MAG TPA: hypothetical protein VJX67_15920 [Blastocatellia bacterium]|nr:hypothetical protein [Blastocatellia bacterium]